MELDPLTFTLEIVNFLVLLWLLKRFLYKPVKSAIAQRQLGLTQALDDAQSLKNNAATLEQEYRVQLEHWEQEKALQQEQLRQALIQERDTAMEKMAAAAEAEKKRLMSLIEQDHALQKQQLHHQASKEALKITTRMLQRLQGETLDQLLIKVLVEDLASMPDDEMQTLSNTLKQQNGLITVNLAHEQTTEQNRSLEQSLINSFGQPIRLNTQLQPELMSGLHLSIGAHVLQVSLKDELAFFERGLIHNGK